MLSETIPKSLIEWKEYDDLSDQIDLTAFDRSMFIAQMDEGPDGAPIEATIHLHRHQAEQLMKFIGRWLDTNNDQVVS